MITHLILMPTTYQSDIASPPLSPNCRPQPRSVAQDVRKRFRVLPGSMGQLKSRPELEQHTSSFIMRLCSSMYIYIHIHIHIHIRLHKMVIIYYSIYDSIRLPMRDRFPNHRNPQDTLHEVNQWGRNSHFYPSEFPTNMTINDDSCTWL